jgi:hypothetical protein
VEMLLDHSTRHGLARWCVLGRCYQGSIEDSCARCGGLLDAVSRPGETALNRMYAPEKSAGSRGRCARRLFNTEEA